MSRINILWVIDHVCYDGQLHGGGRLYWNVVPHFNKDRFRIIPCLLRADKKIRDLFKSAPTEIRFLDKSKYDLTTLWTFLELIRQEKINLMHLHCYGASTFGRIAGLLSGIPTIIHDYDTQIYFPYPAYLWLFDRLLAPFTHRALAASPMVRDYMINKRGINPKKVGMMFHAVPADRYEQATSENIEKVKRELRLDPKDKVILVPTKIGPGRGNKFLLKAAKLIIEKDPTVFFLVAYKWTYFHRQPDGRYVEQKEIKSKDKTMSELNTMADNLGVCHRVLFRESWNNMRELYALSHCVVAPFLSERFSSVNLLEAMAQGVPIVATNIGEPREFIEDGQNGFLVPPGDENALASKILQIIEDREQYARLSENSRIYSRRYSLGSFVKTLESLYLDLVTNNRKKI